MQRLIVADIDVVPRLPCWADVETAIIGPTHFQSISLLRFEARLVPDGTNGVAELEFQAPDGEIQTVETYHDDDGVAAGTYSVYLKSDLVENDVLDGLLTGITHNTNARTPVITRVLGESSSGPWGRGLILAGTHTLNVTFSTNIATHVTVLVWYLPTARILS